MRFLVCLLALLALAGPSDAAVAFDAFNTGATGTGNLSWTHTPSGTPRAAIVVCQQHGDGANVDEVSGVTYGGVTMTELHTPLLHASGTEDGALYTYFLGASVPTGAQTVAVTVTGTFTRRCNSTTLTASENTEMVDLEIIDTVIDDLSTTLALTGRTSFAMLHFIHGGGSTGGPTELTDWTNRQEHDFGNAVTGTYTYNVIGTTDVTAGFTDSVGANNSMVAIAIAEVTVGGGAASPSLLLTGVGS